MANIEAIGIDALDTVVELDRATHGSRRRDFFAKRFEAQQENPPAFISIGATVAGKMVGFACCHMLNGEFGSQELIAVLDAISVQPQNQGHGIGHALLKQLIDEVRQRGGRELRTQAAWNQPGVLDFFSSTGFTLAPRLILERSTLNVQF